MTPQCVKPMALLVGVAVLCTACDSPLMPADLDAQSAASPLDSLVSLDQMSDRELLMAILARLDAVEDRIDSLLEPVASARTGDGSTTIAVDKPDDPGSQGGGQQEDIDFIRNKADSIMTLLNWWAEDHYGITPLGRGWGGLTICGQAALGPKLGSEWDVYAEGEGKGSVGAWAGTGAFAGLLVRIKKNLKFGLELGGGLTLQGCRNFLTARSSRSMPSRNNDPIIGGPSVAVQASAVEDEPLINAIETLQAALGIDGSRLTTALTQTQNLMTAAQSFGQIRDIGASVTIPPVLSSLVDDPLGTVGGVIPDIGNRIFDFTCGGQFNTGRPRLNDILNDGCAIIGDPTNNPDVLGFIGLRGKFDLLADRFRLACSRVNLMGGQVMSVTNVARSGLSGLLWNDGFFTKRVFPQRSALTCS